MRKREYETKLVPVTERQREMERDRKNVCYSSKQKEGMKKVRVTKF
jgi:hypothetical protein